MEIPKKVRVGRRDYHIVLTGKKDRRDYGYTIYGTRTIVIHKPNKSETFWHELTHAVLYEMGHKQHADEAFVGRFAELLDKAIKTARF